MAWFVSILTALIVIAPGVGCASTPVAAAPTPLVVPELPALSAEQLDAVREREPELADHISRIYEIARLHAQRGENARAEAAARTAQGLLSVGYMLVNERRPVEVAVEAVVAPRRAENSPRPRRHSTHARSSTETTTPNVSPPADGGRTALSERLGQLADRLANLEPDGPEQRVAVQSVESLLIQSHRALAEGALERAIELAGEVERLLVSLREAEDPPAADTTQEDSPQRESAAGDSEAP